jgi:hypothetical protein
MTQYEPIRHETAHRRLEGTVSAEMLARVRAQGENAGPLLAALGRVTMIWNNLDLNLRGTLARRFGPTRDEWMRGSSDHFIGKIRDVAVPDRLAPAWKHMADYFDELRQYRNHFTHGLSGTFVQDEDGRMEAYLTKTFPRPSYEVVTETIYTEDLEELAAHMWAFGDFAGELLRCLEETTRTPPDLPPLPPPYRRQMRGVEPMVPG